MKKQLLFLGILCLGLTTKGQTQWSTNGSGGIYNTALTNKVGIGTSGPATKLDILLDNSAYNDGLQITHPHQDGNLGLFFKNYAGQQWNLWSLAPNHGWSTNTNNFCIYDGAASAPHFFIDRPTSFVGIGTHVPTAKLHSKASGNATGVFGENNATGGTSCAGVEGLAVGVSTSGIMFGVKGTAYDGLNNFGGYFHAYMGGNFTRAIGVFGEVSNPNALTGGVGIAVYGTVGGNNSLGNGPYYAGLFDGDVVTVGGFYFYSDRELKRNILKIDGSLDIIKKLNPVTYNFDTEKNPYIALPSEKQFGFISQEVQKILPDLTKTIIHPAKLDKNGKEISPNKEVLGLNYNGFIALLTKGLQEQQQQIEGQESRIQDLEEKLSHVTGIKDNELSGNEFMMGQNQPNPFTTETTIKYNLSLTTQKAVLNIYDLSGKQIKSIELTEKGESSIKVTNSMLSAGIYIYTLIADGKVVDSKKMILSGE